MRRRTRVVFSALRAASIPSSRRAVLGYRQACGSPAYVKPKFLRFLDLDSRVLLEKDIEEEASANADERRF
jgi:hypothetical protein